MYFDFGNYGSELNYLTDLIDSLDYVTSDLLPLHRNRMYSAFSDRAIEVARSEILDEWQAIFDDSEYPEGYIEVLAGRSASRIETYLAEDVDLSETDEWIADLADAFKGLTNVIIATIERMENQDVTNWTKK